jgi:hypothetical protein
VSFVGVDMSHPSDAQRTLMKAHYRGYIALARWIEKALDH